MINHLSLFFDIKEEKVESIQILPGKGEALTNAPSLLPILRAWFSSYLQGEPTPFPLPLNMFLLTPFQKKVLLECSLIGYGEIMTYQEIGKRIGSHGYRAIGSSLNKNPFPLVIPCHRVIPKKGGVGGFALGEALKRELLLFEKVKVS